MGDRVAPVIRFWLCVALLLTHLVFYLGLTRDVQVAGYTLPAKFFMPGFYIFSGVLIMAVGYLINRITTRKTRPQQQN